MAHFHNSTHTYTRTHIHAHTHTHTHTALLWPPLPSELPLTSGLSSPHLHRCSGEVRGNPRPGSPRRQSGVPMAGLLSIPYQLCRRCAHMRCPGGSARPLPSHPGFPTHRPLPRHQEAAAQHNCHFKVSTRQGQEEQLVSGTAAAPSPSFLVRTVIQVPSSGCPHLRYLSPALPATCPHELSCKGPSASDDFQVSPASTPDLTSSWSRW